VATAKREKAEAREHRAKLADCKPPAHWLELTQRTVNALIRVRDHGRPCISCGARESFEWDAGHYLSRGARPELRFVLDNIAIQCAACNRHKGGNQANFRIGLVARIGLERVEALEGPCPAAKFTRADLAQIRREAAAETRRIERARAAAPSPDSGVYLGACIL
jgi:Bacteriophage Lambda NinG protein